MHIPAMPLDGGGIREPATREVESALDDFHNELSSHTEPDPSEDEILVDLLFHEIQEFERQEELGNAKQQHGEFDDEESFIFSRDYNTDLSLGVSRPGSPGPGDQ
jgi:hypothetical protein